MKEDELQEIEVLAQRRYGRPFSILTEEEKAAIYRDYEGERDVLNAEYMGGEGLANTPTPEGRSAGDVYRAANPLEHLGAVANRGVGSYQKKQAREGLEGLSKDFQLGSRAAGDVAADSQSSLMSMMAQRMRQGGQGQGQPQPAAPAAPVQTQQQPMQPPRPPMQSAGNPAPTMPPLASAGNQPTMPGNPQEWMSYMLRASPDFSKKPKTPQEEEEERIRRMTAHLGGGGMY